MKHQIFAWLVICARFAMANAFGQFTFTPQKTSVDATALIMEDIAHTSQDHHGTSAAPYFAEAFMSENGVTCKSSTEMTRQSTSARFGASGTLRTEVTPDASGQFFSRAAFADAADGWDITVLVETVFTFEASFVQTTPDSTAYYSFTLKSVDSGDTLLEIMNGDSLTRTITLKAGRYSFSVDLTNKVRNDSPSPNISNWSYSFGVPQPKGDLQGRVKRTTDTPFIGVGSYEGTASFGQTLSSTVDSNETALFEIKIVNTDTKPRAFLLKAAETAIAGWKLEYKLDTQDVSAQLRGASGLKLPELPPDGTLLLEARMTPSPAVPHKNLAKVQFTLQGDDPAGTVLDAMLAQTLAFYIPVTLTFYRPDASAFTEATLTAGQSSINAPLELTANRPALFAQNKLGAVVGTRLGLVADGVTPLLVKIEASSFDLELFPEGRKLRLNLDISAGLWLVEGKINGAQLKDTMRLLEPGALNWGNGREFTLTKDDSAAFLWIGPIASDDLRIKNDTIAASSGLPTELKGVITAVLAANEREVVNSLFGIRKPPVFLLHGYNTTGDWGIDFQRFSSREWTQDGADPDNFIRTIRYGQISVRQMVEAKTLQQPNTTLPLEDCAVLAFAEMEKEKRILQANWAFTRFDVVAHSQGGILARMLSSKNSNDRIGEPFRNKDNLYRGRFHRVVTLGTPYNGSVLLSYISALAAKQRDAASRLPKQLDALQPLLQEKFNPFGPQIRNINSRDPHAPWYPDAGAQFHIVRTAIDEGRSPGPGSVVPAYQALGLTVPGAGAAILPRGSDGVVDFDSMGALAPPASVPAHVFDLKSRSVSHADVVGLFGTFDAQTTSSLVSRHVIDALDQNSSADNIQFGSFQLPALLDFSQKAVIESWAAKVAFAQRNAARIAAQAPRLPLSARATQSFPGSYGFQIAYEAGHEPQDNVNWLVQVYESTGTTTNGVALTPQGPNHDEVTLTVNAGLVGDVVLQAIYVDVANNIVVTDPIVVTSRVPSGTTLAGFDLLPGDSAWPVGTRLTPEFLARYDDETSSLRYFEPAQLAMTSSHPGVVSVADPLHWDLLSPGTAQIVVSLSGFRATNIVTVVAPDSGSPSLAIAQAAGGMFVLSWPGSASDFALEQTNDPTFQTPWRSVPGTPFTSGGRLELTLPTSYRTVYFRLKR